MLGEMIGELKGKVIGKRVLSVECCPKIEVSLENIGKILDVDVREIGTFWWLIEEKVGLYGEGQGVVFTIDGEIVTWTGKAIGKVKGKGTEWRASVFFNTSSQKLARLNNIIGMIELIVDEDGNTQKKIWEWY